MTDIAGIPVSSTAQSSSDAILGMWKDKLKSSAGGKEDSDARKRRRSREERDDDEADGGSKIPISQRLGKVRRDEKGGVKITVNLS